MNWQTKHSTNFFTLAINTFIFKCSKPVTYNCYYYFANQLTQNSSPDCPYNKKLSCLHLTWDWWINWIFLRNINCWNWVLRLSFSRPLLQELFHFFSPVDLSFDLFFLQYQMIWRSRHCIYIWATKNCMVTGSYPEQISYQLTGMGAQKKCPQKMRSWIVDISLFVSQKEVKLPPQQQKCKDFNFSFD